MPLANELALSAAMTTPSLILIETRTVMRKTDPDLASTILPSRASHAAWRPGPQPGSWSSLRRGDALSGAYSGSGGLEAWGPETCRRGADLLAFAAAASRFAVS